MKLYVLIGVGSGCLQDVSVRLTLEKAKVQRDKMLKDYGLTNADIPDNQHGIECRWNDENEVHLHEVEVAVVDRTVVCDDCHIFADNS